eukprot:scaffold1361_cov229-Pinguiococcus_pyrenoidosus.AAC.1
MSDMFADADAFNRSLCFDLSALQRPTTTSLIADGSDGQVFDESCTDCPCALRSGGGDPDDDSGDGSNDGLGKGVLAGIIVGAVAVAAFLVGAVIFGLSRSKKSGGPSQAAKTPQLDKTWETLLDGLTRAGIVRSLKAPRCHSDSHVSQDGMEVSVARDAVNVGCVCVS